MANDTLASATPTTDQAQSEIPSRRLTGGEAVVEMLHLHGVDHAFGMGGFQPLPYYDALARQSAIRHILIRDEKHGAFAADAFARVTNRPAVADATLGPGATNLVSGAAESFGASIPVMFLTGDVNRSIAGRAATQESDQVGMLRPTMKQVVYIDRIERIPELVRRAFAIATGGRPGPVLIDMPEDVFHGAHDFATHDLYADDAARAVGSRRIRPDQETTERAAELLAGAQRPVAILGGGIHLSGAYRQVERFVSEAGIPAACTISGKGALSDDHPLALGLCGRFSRIANEYVRDADVLLIAGCKLGEICTDRWRLIPPTHNRRPHRYRSLRTREGVQDRGRSLGRRRAHPRRTHGRPRPAVDHALGRLESACRARRTSPPSLAPRGARELPLRRKPDTCCAAPS